MLQRSSVRRGVLSACRLRGALLARPLSSLPTVESVRTRPRYVTDLSNDLVFLLAEQGSGAAKRECVRREIMAVDGIEYAATQTRIEEMSALVAEKHPIIRFPYQVGIWSAQISGFASIPLVFSFSVAKIFNDYCVTADPPDVGEADTALEVGSWSWGWMEPPLGTISFFILCVQFAREKRLEIGVKPFTQRAVEWQGDRLASAYPQYDPYIIHSYGQAIALDDDKDEIVEENIRIEKMMAELKQSTGV